MRTTSALLTLCVMACWTGIARAAVTPADRLTNPWLGELYQKALDATVRDQPPGLCAEARGLYRFDDALGGRPEPVAPIARDWFTPVTEGLQRPFSGEKYLVDVLEVEKAAMAGVLARRGVTDAKLGAIIAARMDAADPAALARYVERAVPDPALTRLIGAHAGDFDPDHLRLYHSDAVYGRTGPDGKFLQSFLRFFAVVDVEHGEVLFVGEGDCDF